jgi:hypothetical protein
MRRRSFLLLAGGATLFSPRVGGLRQLLDPQRQSNERGTGALCRGGPIRPASASVPPSRMALSGSEIPKFVEPLPTFAGSRVSATDIAVSIEEVQQYVLPERLYSDLPSPFDRGTCVWCYGVGNMPPRYPGFTIEAKSGTPTIVGYSTICRSNLSCRLICRLTRPFTGPTL